jgi:SAM-dependent methyltransferase
MTLRDWHHVCLRDSYTYLKAVGRRIPGAYHVWTLLHGGRPCPSRGDVPVPPEVWDAQYRRGQWHYMRGHEELARYSLLVGYVQHFAPGGAVLDIGCGEGILQALLRPYGYAKYVGLDLSEVAIKQAARAEDAHTLFVVHDAAVYQPTEAFDAIVFNESLYYLHEPLAVVQRYARALTASGVLLTSLYGQSARAQAIGQALSAQYRVLDTVTITHGQTGRSWLCQVLAPATPVSDPRGQ